MHEIQNHILRKLILNKKAKYSLLKPTGIEGNLFSYHLRNLVKNGYITSKLGLYYLAAKGKQYADRLSLETLHIRIQPKIVTLLILKKGNQYVLYRRKRMPFMDHVGFPYGKVHLEERVQEAAERELQEKTGLKAKLKHRGDVYLTVHEETDLVSHMLCHVFTGSEVTGELVTHTSIGECFWSTIEEHPKNQVIPGVSHVLKDLKNNGNKFFFAEHFLNSAEE